MRRKMIGFLTGVALALAVPALGGGIARAADKMEKAEAAPAGGTTNKDDAAKLKEHNKLRGMIAKVKYPATKAEVVAKVKGIKADDKKWFTETLPDKTFTSADDVYQALGWSTTPEAAPAQTK